MNARRMAAALAAALTLAWPTLALACAGCSIGNGRNAEFFFWTTWVLSFSPLIMLGAGIAWLLRTKASFIREEFADGDEALRAKADAIRAGMAPAAGAAPTGPVQG